MIRFSLDAGGRLEISGAGITLSGGIPLLNGQPHGDWDARAAGAEDEYTVTYRSPEGIEFGLQTHRRRSSDLPAWLAYWIAGLPQDYTLDSFGLHFSRVEQARACLRQGYQSWDGSYYLPADSGQDPVTGYAMTQFLPHTGSQVLVLGFDRHDRFQQTFSFGFRPALEVRVETHWDRKDRRTLPRCEGERLLCFTHPTAEGGLRAWAQQVAEASPLPPRVHTPRLTGWCSWYNLYAAIDEGTIREHLDRAALTVRQEQLPMRIFQVDDGFTPEMGDWLEVKPQFPRGMAPLLEEIRRAGFLPGLWIAPSVVGNRSRLYREHPDWVVQDRETGRPLVQAAFYGEFRWHKRSEEYYILDTTHPEAFDYLRTVFRTWRWEWGCEYFKTDFMFYGSEHGPQRAVHYTPGSTRIEIWRQVAEMIRAEIGEEAVWLGCGAPLWASIGLVDGMRTGRDVGVSWEGERAALPRLRDTATRSFANRVLWQADPDVVLLRDRFHYLNEVEVRSLARYAGLAGGVLMTSDDLSGLTPERLRLWKFLLGLDIRSCSFPLLESCTASFARSGAEAAQIPGLDPVIVQVVELGSGEASAAVLCFNPSDQEITAHYPLERLGIPGPKVLREGISGAASAGPVDTLEVKLGPHDSRLFFLY